MQDKEHCPFHVKTIMKVLSVDTDPLKNYNKGHILRSSKMHLLEEPVVNLKPMVIRDTPLDIRLSLPVTIFKTKLKEICL